MCSVTLKKRLNSCLVTRTEGTLNMKDSSGATKLCRYSELLVTRTYKLAYPYTVIRGTIVEFRCI